MQSIMSLMVWLKFLYFLRIFTATSYLIRIIIEVGYDIRHFLLVLLLTFIAFGDAFYAINTSNKEGEGFIEGGYIFGIIYVYTMSLGGFDVTAFGKTAMGMMWILFILCTVLNMIIMLNLLIAIISESFARLNEQKEQAAYQEKARFISENLYLVPTSRRVNFCDKSKYLLYAVDQEDDDAENEETMDQKLRKLKKSLKTH